MKRMLCVILFFSSAGICGVLNEIVKTDSLDLLYQLLPKLNKDSLVIFDRDDTLLQGVSCNMSAELCRQFILLWKEIYSSKDVDSLLRNIEAQNHILVDTRVPDLICQLQERGVNVIILTRGCHGRGPTGRMVEDLCIQVLCSVGIDLKDSFMCYSNTMLSDVVNNGYSPLFKDGILFTNTCDKGESLAAFLKVINFEPNYIIFVDDKLHFVQEVQRAMQQKSIPFLGVHYRGAERLPIPDLRQQCYRMCYLLDRDLA